MNCRSFRLLLLAICLLAFPFRAPAPLIYRPGEGWSYEPVGGGGNWRRPRAKEQLELAQGAFDKHDYSLALKAGRRVVKSWPLSDYAPQAQYLMGRCYEAKGREEKAFKEYQSLLEKHPKSINYDEVLQRQFDIANQYLAGKWFKLWGFIPFFPSMEKTSDMYDKIVRNGPYSELGPQAQMQMGAAREKQKNFPLAAKAFETAADRYNDRPKVAAEALYREGLAYQHQAQTAEYDQNTASQAIATYTDFMTLFPNDPRVREVQKSIGALKTEQARGSYQVAKFYEKYKKWNGALIYYNEVLLQDPSSPYASEARQRIDVLKQRTRTASK